MITVHLPRHVSQTILRDHENDHTPDPTRTIEFDPSVLERFIDTVNEWEKQNIALRAVICGEDAYYSLMAIEACRRCNALPGTMHFITSPGERDGLCIVGVPVYCCPSLPDRQIHGVGDAEAIRVIPNYSLVD